MDEKRQIISSFIPVAVLKPMTDEACEAVPQDLLTDGLIKVSKFPFKIGRESRVQELEGRLLRIERPRVEGGELSNDLYLLDKGEKLNISREHLLIEEVDGLHFAVDRGSVCGIKINGESVGGDGTSGRKELNDGDTILIGCRSTPYIYKFITLEDHWGKEYSRQGDSG